MQSELIALADTHATREEVLALAINNELCRQIDASEKMDSLRVTSKIVALPIMQGLLAAANQSGSERAGVDALREALEFGIWAVSGPTNEAEVERLEQIIEETWREYQAKATPPAQPAPAATHGKPDGAVRTERCELCFGTGRHGGRFSYNDPDCTNCNGAGKVAALHSPKIAAAETGPGDVVAWQWFSGGSWQTVDKTDVENPEQYARSISKIVRPIYAAIDRLDVKAEAKSQEPEAVAVKPLECCAPIERLLEFVTRTANQKTTDEFEDHELEGADYEGAYDIFVMEARVVVSAVNLACRKLDLPRASSDVLLAARSLIRNADAEIITGDGRCRRHVNASDVAALASAIIACEAQNGYAPIAAPTAWAYYHDGQNDDVDHPIFSRIRNTSLQHEPWTEVALYTHPTTKPEAPAVSVDAIYKAVLTELEKKRRMPTSVMLATDICTAIAALIDGER